MIFFPTREVGSQETISYLLNQVLNLQQSVQSKNTNTQQTNGSLADNEHILPKSQYISKQSKIDFSHQTKIHHYQFQHSLAGRNSFIFCSIKCMIIFFYKYNYTIIPILYNLYNAAYMDYRS